MSKLRLKKGWAPPPDCAPGYERWHFMEPLQDEPETVSVLCSGQLFERSEVTLNRWNWLAVHNYCKRCRRMLLR